MGPTPGLRRRGRVLPLRTRLVLGFSAAMLVVLTAAGAFVFWRVAYALDRGLDTDLDQATTTIAASLASPTAPTVPGVPAANDANDAADATGATWEVLDPRGTVITGGGPTLMLPSLDAGRLSGIGDRVEVIDVGTLLPVTSTPSRSHLSRLPGDGGYLLVAVRRDHRDEALRELLLQLTATGLATFLVTAAVGDRLARAALTPVERYRRRAAEIAGGASGLRLEVPEDRDDEVTRLGTTLNEMLAAQDAVMERQEHFVHEASHELRTPLTLLKSRVQLARRRPRSVAEHEEVLDELGVDVTRLIHLADQLLALGDGSVGAPGVGCDLGVVVTEVADRLVTGEAHSPVTLTRSGPGTALPVTLSATEIERVVLNLVTNASTHGRAPIGVHLDGAHPGWARLVVSDAGPGMSSELLATATDRFARAPAARALPGSGLGLALVRAIVEQAHGELRLCHVEHHTSVGRSSPVSCPAHPGTAVTVLLPTAPAD